MSVNGVRNSWLTLLKNVVFARSISASACPVWLGFTVTYQRTRAGSAPARRAIASLPREASSGEGKYVGEVWP